MNLTHTTFIFILLLMVSSCMTPAPESVENKVLPTTWSKDFSIYLYTGGGMQNESMTINFTYDSCKYVEKKGDEKKIIAFALTDLQRTEILEKMKSLQVDKIISKKTEDIAYDKESSDLCFHWKTEFCLSDGATSEIVEKDVPNYSAAYQYLSNFAQRKKIN